MDEEADVAREVITAQVVEALVEPFQSYVSFCDWGAATTADRMLYRVLLKSYH